MIAEVRRDKTERIVQNNRTADKRVLPQQLIKTHCVMTFKNSEVHFGCDVSLRRLRSWVKVSFLARYCHIKGRGLEVLLPANLCWQPLLAAPPTTSVIAEGVGVPFPARLAVGSSCTAKMWMWRCPFTKTKKPRVPWFCWSNRTHPRISNVGHVVA